jgi:adenylate kinase family enzyme
MCKLLASDGELPTICKPGTSAKVHHISVGDLLRKEKARGALPPEITEKVEKQILMDGREIVKIIASAGVEEVLGRGEVVILDGFPRNLDQLHAFRERVSAVPCFPSFCIMKLWSFDD